MDPEVALKIFLALFIFRYTRLLVGILANFLYRPYPVADNPSYTTQDAAVIIPTTFKQPAQLHECIRNIVLNAPGQVFVVAANSSVEAIQNMLATLQGSHIEVLGVARLNKREQLLHALQLAELELVVFADDNVLWPEEYLRELLAVFEDAAVGAGGTRQRVRRRAHVGIWDFLAIGYLERRVFNNITTQAVDGSISTLSGRTAAYRSHILKNDAFFHYFLNDTWRGRRLNSDDDKCLTRFVYSRGWKIALQSSTVIETTMEPGWRYLRQCVRWARAHWRGNLTVMAQETYWRSPEYLWGCYAVYLSQFLTPAVLMDGLLLWFWRASVVQHRVDVNATTTLLIMWLLLTKLIKLFPHFCKHPADLRFVLVSILFSYLHGFINIYALLSLRVTTWGSQDLESFARPGIERMEASFLDDAWEKSEECGDKAFLHECVSPALAPI